MNLHLLSGSPSHMGARFDGEGTNFAVFSANATRMVMPGTISNVAEIATVLRVHFRIMRPTH